MGARFIGGNREQVFLMPPSVTDWVPEDHLVWTVLEAVGELDLSSFYADYRVDGRDRRPRAQLRPLPERDRRRAAPERPSPVGAAAFGRLAAGPRRQDHRVA